MLLAYTRALVRNNSVAEDAVQQAFIRILSLSKSELEEVRDLQAWLVRIVHNTAINIVRSASRSDAREQIRRNTAQTEGVFSQGPPTRHTELLAAVSTLSQEYRELLLLRHVAGLTFDQIAWSLELNRNTVASRYRSAIERLRTMLACEEGAKHG